MSFVQTQAQKMMLDQGFLGVPTATFEKGGRRQLSLLLNEGLTPEAKVLDIGCGCLRTAYWLIRFLNPGCYFGLEPVKGRVEYGLEYLFSPAEIKAKQPEFDFNASFDSSVFGVKFDFFIEGSIWSHASKQQIETNLNGFLQDSAPTGVFLTSYLPAQTPQEDYLGEKWVGTSHESSTPGVIRHSLQWIEEQCHRRDLFLVQLPGVDFDSQYWLRISKKEPQELTDFFISGSNIQEKESAKVQSLEASLKELGNYNSQLQIKLTELDKQLKALQSGRVMKSLNFINGLTSSLKTRSKRKWR